MTHASPLFLISGTAMFVSRKRKELEQHAFVLHMLKTITIDQQPGISLLTETEMKM